MLSYDCIYSWMFFRLESLGRSRFQFKIKCNVVHWNRLLICWIMLKITKDIFPFCIVSWIWLKQGKWNYNWNNNTCCLPNTANTMPADMRSGDFTSQGINRHGIDPQQLEYSVSSIRWANMNIFTPYCMFQKSPQNVEVCNHTDRKTETSLYDNVSFPLRRHCLKTVWNMM